MVDADKVHRNKALLVFVYYNQHQCHRLYNTEKKQSQYKAKLNSWPKLVDLVGEQHDDDDDELVYGRIF